MNGVGGAPKIAVTLGGVALAILQGPPEFVNTDKMHQRDAAGDGDGLSGHEDGVRSPGEARRSTGSVAVDSTATSLAQGWLAAIVESQLTRYRASSGEDRALTSRYRNSCPS